MRILVTGKAGQLASSLLERAALLPALDVIAVGRPELDLLDKNSVLTAIAAVNPDIVVSAAAYTSVDQAEDEPELAYAVNVEGAAAVAEAAALVGAPVIHVSTDYVFSGGTSRPYREDDPKRPATIYGRTKLEGERAVAQANPRYVILRTAWLYSPFGKNFVRTMLRLARDRETIPIVADQWGNPTCALDLADAVLRVAQDFEDSRSGIYHCAGTGETNWAGFARFVFDTSRTLGGPTAEVREVATADFAARAPRPLNSRLSSDKFESTFGWRSPLWTLSASRVVERVLLSEVVR